MRPSLLAWSVAAWLTLGGQEASACICRWHGRPDAREQAAAAAAEAPVSFEGKVLEFGSRGQDERSARVQVTRVARGKVAAGEVVEVRTSANSCGVWLRPGTEVVVNASEGLETGMCLGTRQLTPEPAFTPLTDECRARMEARLDVARRSYDEVLEGPVVAWRTTEAGGNEVRIKAARVWKGSARPGQEITVRTRGSSATSPDVEHLLVFGRRAAGGVLETDECSPSRGFWRDEDARVGELGAPPAVPALRSSCGACAVGGERGAPAGALGAALGPGALLARRLSRWASARGRRWRWRGRGGASA